MTCGQICLLFCFTMDKRVRGVTKHGFVCHWNTCLSPVFSADWFYRSLLLMIELVFLFALVTSLGLDCDWDHVWFWVGHGCLSIDDSIKFSRLTNGHLIEPCPVTSVILLWTFTNLWKFVDCIMPAIFVVQLVEIIAHSVTLETRPY